MRGDTDSWRTKGRTNSHALAGRQAGRQAGRVSSVTSNARALSCLSVCLSCKAKNRAARPGHVSSSSPRCQNKQSGHTTVSGNMYVMMSRSRRASPKPPKALQECVCSGAGPPGGSRLASAREGRKRHEHAKRRLVSRFGLVRGGWRMHASSWLLRLVFYLLVL